MFKNFDGWNEIKKIIHNKNPHRLYHERDIWWCSLGINIGFEEEGTGAFGERPVLILKGFSEQVCLVIPLTTSKKKNPYHVPVGIIGGKEAFAIISQLRLIDTKRFVNKVGRLEKDIFETIRKTIKDML